MSNILTCEQVSAGHPEKICDQIADAIVTDCLKHDENSRAGVEVLIKDYNIIIAGEITSTHNPDYPALVDQVFTRIGKHRLGYDSDKFTIHVMVSEQSPDIAQGVDRDGTGVLGAGDQGMMFGYATNETAELLPIPFVLATRFLELLADAEDGAVKPLLRADAKAQASFDYESSRITTFLCSTQTVPGTDLNKVKNLVGNLMKRVALEYGLNTDFEILVNPTGKFEIGGSFADAGVTGRKLACDTYDGVGHIGGGALSGKDVTKVDRSGAYAVRKVARDIVTAGYADRCEVQIAYAIGVAKPVSIHVETFGTKKQSKEFIEQYVAENYDLTPRGIIDSLELRNVDYNLVSSLGHFGKDGLPWEM